VQSLGGFNSQNQRAECSIAAILSDCWMIRTGEQLLARQDASRRLCCSASVRVSVDSERDHTARWSVVGRSPKPVERTHPAANRSEGGADARARQRGRPDERRLRPCFTIAHQPAEKPQLFLRYTTLALRQRLRRLNEGTQLGMALEGLTAADLAYQQNEIAA